MYSYNFPEDGRRLKLLGMQYSHPLLSRLLTALT